VHQVGFNYTEYAAVQRHNASVGIATSAFSKKSPHFFSLVLPSKNFSGYLVPMLYRCRSMT